MKKILSMMLSLVLLLNLSITVFAKEDTIASASDAQSVIGQDITDTGIIYPEEQPEMISETGEDSVINIEITWGTMNFTFSDKMDGDAKEGWSWEDGANTVTVVNNSEVNVTAEISYKPNDSYTSITGSISGSSGTISKGESATFNLKLLGEPNTALSGAEIGSLTVTITNADNQSNAVMIVDEDAEETDEEAENETDNSNTALEEESNDTDTVADTGENVQDDKDTAEGTENSTDDQNTALNEKVIESTDPDTIQMTEGNDEVSNVTGNEEIME